MSSQALAPGTSLGSRYLVVAELGAGGFGITYVGQHQMLGRRVAIKEFFPDGTTRRGTQIDPPRSMTSAKFQASREAFIREARALQLYNRPDIVRVDDIFEQHSTAYMVMEYIQGRTLSDELSAHGGRLSVDAALNYGIALATAPVAVHEKQLLHRDIKPSNVMLRRDGRIVLIDFGAARNFVHQRTSPMTAIGTAGYSPLEQYGSAGRSDVSGPASDVYALAATLYHLITGSIPASAPDRALGLTLREPRELNSSVGPRLNHALVRGLALHAKDRPQNMAEFRELLLRAPQMPLTGVQVKSQYSHRHSQSARARSKPGNYVPGVQTSTQIPRQAGPRPVPVRPRKRRGSKRLIGLIAVLIALATVASRLNSSSTVRAVTVSTLAGPAAGNAGYVDGMAGDARFSHPSGIALDSHGAMYVADSSNHRLRKITPDGRVSTIVSDVTWDNTIPCFFSSAGPKAVAVDSTGNLYVTVCDSVLKVGPDGTLTNLAGTHIGGFADGPGATAEFDHPEGIAVDASGTVYVADSWNHRIRRITPDGMVSTFAGSEISGHNDGASATAQFMQPVGVAVDKRDAVYVTDKDDNCVRKVTSDGTVSTVAGPREGGKHGYADGRGSQARFDFPFFIAVDSAGNVYVTDLLNDRVRMVTMDGTVSSPIHAKFNGPEGITIDANGAIYVDEAGYNRVRKIVYNSPNHHQ